MSEDREKKVIQLFHAQGYGEIVSGYMKTIFERIKPILDDKDQEMLQRFQKELVDASFDLSVEIFAKTFSDEEIEYMQQKMEHPMEISIRQKNPQMLKDLVEGLTKFVDEAGKRMEKEMFGEEWEDPQ